MDVTSRGNIVDSGTEHLSDVGLPEPMLLTCMPHKAKRNITGEGDDFESSREEGSLVGNMGSDSTSTESEGAGITPRQADRHLSKTLAYILRHGTKKYNYEVQSGGYLFVDEILSCQPGLKGYSVEDICRVVRLDDNKRFGLSTDDKTGRLKIKANHGHSIPIHDSDLVLIKQGEVTRAYHCTSMLGWDGIVGMGINRMGRVHIHFSTRVTDSLKPHWEVIIQVFPVPQWTYFVFREFGGYSSSKVHFICPAFGFRGIHEFGPPVSLRYDEESVEAKKSDLICEIGSSFDSVSEVRCVRQDTSQVSEQVKGSYDFGAHEPESTRSEDPGKHFFDNSYKSIEWGKVGPNTEQSGNWSNSTGDGISEIEDDPPPGYSEATREPGDEISGRELDNTLVTGMQYSEGDPENVEGVITVCRLRSGSVFRAPGRIPIISWMNGSDKHVTIPENEMIARAVEVEILPGKEIEMAQRNDPWVCKVQGEDNSLAEEGVPNHLKDLFNKSKANLDTDGQKQIPTELPCPGLSTEVELSDLPCKGCKYCAKAHRQWSGFAEDEDYVVPLASKVTPKPEVRRVQSQASSRGQDLDEIHVSRVMILVADGNVIVSPDTGEMSIQVVQDEYGVGLGKYAEDEICESQGKDPE
ncbi:TRPT1 [Mytilus coruscus]|uniref:2'-phosphotransferase n=1 Tax=Mytilus coruscus TaxID=42192 RepID=A0A6J8B633_MYTCO|nr:TRPT1 [Mytilus coruscus]